MENLDFFKKDLSFDIDAPLDDDESSRDVQDDIAYQVVHGLVSEFEKNKGDLTLNYIFEGVSANKRPNFRFYKKCMDKISEEVNSIDVTTQAYYEFIVEGFSGNSKLFTTSYEVSVSLKRDTYIVSCEHHVFSFHKDPVSRDLDFDDKEPLHTDTDTDLSKDNDIMARISKDPRLATLDFDKPKRTRGGVKEDPRYWGLEYENFYRFKKEASRQTLVDPEETTTKSKGKKKQIETSEEDSVSAGTSKKVDDMTPQKALDAVDSARDAWEDADSFRQYNSTLDLYDKWFGYNVVLVDSFSTLDKLEELEDLLKEAARIEDSMDSMKSAVALSKAEDQLGKLKDSIDEISPDIEKALGDAKNYDEVIARRKEIERNIKAYEKEYKKNMKDWSIIQGKVKKLGKHVEILEAIRRKYAPNTKLPNLITKYKNLMTVRYPSLIDMESLKEVNMAANLSLGRKVLREYRTMVEDFGKSFMSVYDCVAPILETMTKSRSLF